MSKRIASLAVVVAFLVAFPAASVARAQEGSDSHIQPSLSEPELGAPDLHAAGPPRWLPWLGCWESDTGFPADGQPADAERGETERGETEPGETQPGETQPEAGQPRPPDVWVCVAAEGEHVRVTTLVDGASVHEETLRADGAQQSFETSGCTGWRTTSWSRDEARLFLASEQQCHGDLARAAAGISFLDWHGVWLDIQSVVSEGRRDILVRRYHRVSREQTEAAGFDKPTPGPSLWSAMSAARARLSIEDVVELCSRLGPDVVEATLLANGVGFPIDSGVLVQLADAGVRPYVIDLMVALSFPAMFEVVNTVPYAFVTQTAGAPVAQIDLLGPGLGDGYGSCGYWNPFYFAPECDAFAGYSYGLDYGEPIAVQRTRGRIVKGQGYTRISPRNATDRASGGTSTPSSGDSGSSTSVSSSGYTSSGSTGRTAKARE